MTVSQIAIAEYELEKTMDRLKLHEGVANIERILTDLNKSNLSVFPVLTILDNNKFNLFYDHRTAEIFLKTTYSNQTINEEFLQEAQTLNNLKESLLAGITKVILNN